MLIDAAEATSIAKDWLRRYGKAMSSGDVNGITSTILPDGWFRDVLILTWDYRALEGTSKITGYLSKNLKCGDIWGFELVQDKFCPPVYVPSFGWIEAVFTFESRIAHGRGFARLAFHPDSGQWAAVSASMLIDDLKGDEEPSHESGIYGGHTLAWSDVLQERKAKVEAEPHVLIGM